MPRAGLGIPLLSAYVDEPKIGSFCGCEFGDSGGGYADGNFVGKKFAVKALLNLLLRSELSLREVNTDSS
jgi:hypothetical protein